MQVKIGQTISTLVGIAAAAALATNSHAADINVPGDQPTIQVAIDDANPGDVVIVAVGEYFENINFNGKAITVRSTFPNIPVVVLNTIINGGGSGTVVTCSSGEGSNTVLNGFVITGGNAVGGGGGGMLNNSSSPTVANCIFDGNTADEGGGMWNNFASPTVTNCVFSGNIVIGLSGQGGGMLNNFSSPTVTDCTFDGNSARRFGGGMFNTSSTPSVTNCTFSGNSANSGGGMANDDSIPTVIDCTFSGNAVDFNGGGMFNVDSSPTVTDCSFSGNSAGSGGGMHNNSSSSPAVTNCTFSGNSANSGGGMANTDDSSPTLTNCMFSGNTATGLIGQGGGMFVFNGSSPTIVNCLFACNQADGSGGAITTGVDSFPRIVNCTIVDNTTGLSGEGLFTTDLAGGHSEVTVTNCIFDFTGGLQIVNAGGALTHVNYSNVRHAGTGNILVDPRFVDPTCEGNDYRLRGGSRCIDAANNVAVPARISTDLNGNPRFQDDAGTVDTGNPPGGAPIVDMGAYEFQGTTPCLADVNGDGVINVLDLIELFLCFGAPANPPCDTGQDVNRDGDVNVLDLVDVLRVFGTACGLSNDACFARVAIAEGLTPFDTTDATTDGPAEPGCTEFGPVNDIWYNYNADFTGDLTVTTCEQLNGSATFNTVLAIYDGCNCVPLSPLLGCNDDDPVNDCGTAPGGFQSTIAVPVTAGNCYKIRVGGFAGDNAGTGTLSVSFACAGGATLYGSDRDSNLFILDVTTGMGMFVGGPISNPTKGPPGVTEIEYDNIGMTAFAQHPDGAFTGNFFDINTGVPTSGPIGNGGSYTGLEYVDDTLYGTVIFAGGGGSPSELHTLDPAFGTHTFIGLTGVGAISGIAYDVGAGIMYGIAGGPGPATLYTINLATGQATVVGTTGLQAGSLQFGPDGNLYAGGTGPNFGELHRIDPASGASTFVGDTGFGSVTGLTLRGTCP